LPLPVTVPVSAIGTLTSSGVFVDTQTVTVGGKVYTTQTTLTNSDGNVFIGGSASATLQNLLDAINLTGTPGTQYAAAMTRNAQVFAVSKTATTLVVKAKSPGTIGNLIASTESQTNVAWGAATLASGTGDPALFMSELIAAGQVNSDMVLALTSAFPLRP
jgi:hypothetical protein